MVTIFPGFLYILENNKNYHTLLIECILVYTQQSMILIYSVCVYVSDVYQFTCYLLLIIEIVSHDRGKVVIDILTPLKGHGRLSRLINSVRLWSGSHLIWCPAIEGASLLTSDNSGRVPNCYLPLSSKLINIACHSRLFSLLNGA